MKRIILATLVFVIGSFSIAADGLTWSGYDYDKSTYIDINEGNTVRSGNTVEVYDYNTGYRYMDVNSVSRFGGTVTIEALDMESGEMRSFEMDE